MSNIFLTSDTHFYHQGMCEFTNRDGSKVRPWTDAKEMTEAMVENWNSVVKPEDKVYHLGDVAFTNQALKVMGKLNGSKILIRGNHDNLKPREYLTYFKDIRSYKIIDKYIMSHIPIHPDSLSRWVCNIHGHTHGNNIYIS